MDPNSWLYIPVYPPLHAYMPIKNGYTSSFRPNWFSPGKKLEIRLHDHEMP